ncbi:MAG: PilW family protein, partial [Candidatus Aminicenantales bacterium]
MRHPTSLPIRARGFTLIELLIGTVVMFIVVVGALQIYSRSNKISADQQEFVEIQTDIRAAMYFLSRDARMIGTGLTESLAGYALEGVDNESTGTSETPDRLKILGNFEDTLVLSIQSYHGSSSSATLEDFSFERYPYPDNYYVGKIALVVPHGGSTCQGAGFRQITNVVHNADGTMEKANFSSGKAPNINPPRGLSDICASDEFIGGAFLFCEIREYWLDVTGNVSGLTAGMNGYIGGGLSGVLYMTLNDKYYPIAQNVETIQ